MWKQKLRQWSRQHSTALVCGQEDTVRPRHSKASLKPEPVMRIHLREGMKARRHASISMGIVTKTCSVAGWWRREGVESPKFNNGVNVGKKTLRHWILQARTTSSSIPQLNGSHDLEFCWRVHLGHQYGSENQTHRWTCCHGFSFTFYFSLRVCFPSVKVF